MGKPETLTYARDGRIGRITLDRPERGNGITLEMPAELAAAVEEANLDPGVHVIALAGNGSGFCGGYDLGAAEAFAAGAGEGGAGRPDDPATIAANHDPGRPWDPVLDFQMMARNLRGFMSLFHSDKPVICKIHGFCVAGGTDMALCSDLIVTEDRAKIGYPPARVWGVPTSMLWAHRVGLERARRLLLTGDSIDGTTAVEWGLASEAASRAELDGAFERLLERVARLPVNQLVMHKLAINAPLTSQGLHANQVMSVFFDGIARHTPEGYEFARRAGAEGFREAVRSRDQPFGDHGLGR
ncbi:MAG TPA: crotonase/enoyl-CoA hydratase family protein [Solirubrobacterales bacterium]|nr:crotonase/enoyl-CoA hydratase family protein [Solirubrobacterales bacterium]